MILTALSFLMLCVASFFVGSIPFGYIIGRFRGVDLRQLGSGNTGATNAARTLGKRAGLATLVLDVAKGAFAAAVGFYLLPKMFLDLSPWGYGCLLGLCALLGHCFSPFLHFQGGKGVATGVGVFLVLAPLETLLALAVFAISLKTTRWVSLSSMLAAASLPISILLLQRNPPPELLLATIIASCLIIVRHRANIARLIAGTEPAFTLSKKTAEG